MSLEIQFFFSWLTAVDFFLKITGNLWSSWLPAVLQRRLCHSASSWLHSTGPAQRFELKDWAWHRKQRTLATLSDTTAGFLLFSVISEKAITCPSCKNIYKVYTTRLQQRPCVVGLLRPLCLRPVLCCHRESTYAVFFSIKFSDSTLIAI